MLDSLKQHNLVGLAYGFNGFRRLINSKQVVSTINDIQNLKIAIPGTATQTGQNTLSFSPIQPLFESILNQWQAQPHPIAPHQLQSALQDNIVDGHINPLHLIRSLNLYENQTHLTLWEYSFDPLVFCLSQQTWQELSPEHQTAVRTAANAAATDQRKTVIENEATHLAFFINRGMQVSTPTSGAAQAFIEAASSVINEQKTRMGEDFYNRFVSAINNPPTNP